MYRAPQSPLAMAGPRGEQGAPASQPASQPHQVIKASCLSRPSCSCRCQGCGGALQARRGRPLGCRRCRPRRPHCPRRLPPSGSRLFMRGGAGRRASGDISRQPQWQQAGSTRCHPHRSIQPTSCTQFRLGSIPCEALQQHTWAVHVLPCHTVLVPQLAGRHHVALPVGAQEQHVGKRMLKGAVLWEGGGWREAAEQMNGGLVCPAGLAWAGRCAHALGKRCPGLSNASTADASLCSSSQRPQRSTPPQQPA